MRLEMLKSKLQRARITGKDIHYEGSLALDPLLMEAVGLLPYEKIQVVNVNNGSRLETYVIPGNKGRGEVILNGAAARAGEVGDVVILLAYAQVDAAELPSFQPRIALLDERNAIIEQSNQPTLAR